MLYENWGILIVSIDGAATYGFLKYAAQAIDSANPLNARNIYIYMSRTINGFAQIRNQRKTSMDLYIAALSKDALRKLGHSP